MNERLNKLQKIYEEKIPTDFNENDKQAIWKNIKQDEQHKPVRKHIMPKVATVFALTFALVIGIYFLGDNLPFMNQNGAKNWNQDDAEEVIEGFFKDTDYSNPYFYDHDFSHRNLKIESMSYLSNHLFEVETNMGHYIFRVNEAYDIDVFDYIEHMEQHQLEDKHDSRTEEKIYNILKDPSVFESLIGTGEIEGVEHIGGNIYEFITTSFPDTYLAVVDDGAMDVYGPEKEIRDFELTGEGENWKATYSVRRVGWNNQESSYTLSYIGEESVPESFDYQSEDGGFSGSIDDDWNGEPVSLGGSCGGCSTDEDDPIDITFEWDGHTETITLTAE